MLGLAGVGAEVAAEFELSSLSLSGHWHCWHHHWQRSGFGAMLLAKVVSLLLLSSESGWCCPQCHQWISRFGARVSEKFTSLSLSSMESHQHCHLWIVLLCVVPGGSRY